jgi:RHH-type proline utilization regulon transcriptional repressor/proline dehydrogenase/delta 1-pyrroline-5-carboxylate dehydrogenase
MVDALYEAGVSREVVQLLPGIGETVGAHLVRHPNVANIAFTGSKGVGLEILHAANATGDAPQLKRVIVEMGGKNAIIVDASADPDEAVLGVRDSAFNYAGQKCSACSRVIVLDSIHDAFVARLIEATRELRIGDPLLPSTDVGPVIDDAAAEKIRHYLDIGRSEAGQPVLGNEQTFDVVRGKTLIRPVIFTGVRPEHRIGTDEIFGPVLSVMRASTFDDALAIANSSRYKLTGGVYSRTPSHLEKARRGFRVGNLYLNRGITGALVGRQPFGGFGLSGGGSKAGGREYLLHFVDTRVATENTIRRGFAPDA